MGTTGKSPHCMSEVLCTAHGPAEVFLLRGVMCVSCNIS